jgi:hypothetical protein
VRALLYVVAILTGATAALVSGAGAASAHHGFTGEYDAARPLYVQGTVDSATYGYPHGLIHINPARPATAPTDLTELSPQEQDNLGGLDVVTKAAPVQAAGEGQLTLLLPPPMTTEVAGRADRPEAGDNVGAVVFRECTTGELRVQLLRISAQEHIVRSGVMQTEVDRCPGADTGAAASDGSAATPDAAGEAVRVPADEEERGVPFGLVLTGALLVSVATGAALIAAARRPRTTATKDL